MRNFKKISDFDFFRVTKVVVGDRLLSQQERQRLQGGGQADFDGVLHMETSGESAKTCCHYGLATHLG